METGTEQPSIEPYNTALSELKFSPEKSHILKEGFKSAKNSRDLLQARLSFQFSFLS